MAAPPPLGASTIAVLSVGGRASRVGQCWAASALGERGSCLALCTFLLPFYGRGWHGVPCLAGAPCGSAAGLVFPSARSWRGGARPGVGRPMLLRPPLDGRAPTLQGLERAAGISCAHLGSMGLLLPAPWHVGCVTSWLLLGMPSPCLHEARLLPPPLGRLPRPGPPSLGPQLTPVLWRVCCGTRRWCPVT